jgi:hypothetical protein
MSFIRSNSLTLCFGVLFLVTVVAESLVGLRVENREVALHGGEAVTWARYILSSEFGAALLENWQSEYLQFMLFVLATVWLVQKGSADSKDPADVGVESDLEQRVGRYAGASSPTWAKADGIRRRVYENSLVMLMAAIFLASWVGQSVTGWATFNHEQEDHGRAALSWLSYLGRADFWERTFQNWQSEFLAVGSIAIFSVYLRQRGSAESKPVGASHDETGAA